MLFLSLLVGLKHGAEAPMGHHGQPFRQCLALQGGQAAWLATPRRFLTWSPYGWPGPAQKQRRGGQRLRSRGFASHREHYNPSRTGAIGKTKQVLVCHRPAAVIGQAMLHGLKPERV